MKFLEFNSLFVLKSHMVKQSFTHESKSDWVVFGHFNHLKNSLLETQLLWNKMDEFYNLNFETP